MSATRARRLILLALLLAVASTSANRVLVDKRPPQLEAVLGALLAALLLSLLAEASPDAAGGLAVLILISAIVAGPWARIARPLSPTAQR